MQSPKNKTYTIYSNNKLLNILGISKKTLSKILISEDSVQKKNIELIYNLNNLLEHYKIDDLPESLIDHINYIKLQLSNINNKSTITHNTYGLYGLYSFYNNIFDEYDI